ncbi:uncharacterized protein LOC131050476 [Cryptomeria japonica]|uniref:uncharacterized protein LOC131050476 n=1 Tax=Cryptomeria japonica TaxID=3369 RepID=UPI0025AD0F51|nr:uncharacterized protein LOC131050476 [Cryptomeria japonica]
MGESENSHTNEKVSAMEAVLLGALGPGVNRPTWTVLKCVLLALGVCLATMFYAAMYSSHSVMAFHVFVLVLLSGGLFILLSWFLSQTGIVSVEEQMKDMNVPSKQAMAKKER